MELALCSASVLILCVLSCFLSRRISHVLLLSYIVFCFDVFCRLVVSRRNYHVLLLSYILFCFEVCRCLVHSRLCLWCGHVRRFMGELACVRLSCAHTWPREHTIWVPCAIALVQSGKQCFVLHLGRHFQPLIDSPSDIEKVRPNIYSIMRAQNSHSGEVTCWDTNLWFSRIWKLEPIQWPQTICDFGQIDNTLWAATEPSPQHEKHKVRDSRESQFVIRDTRTLPGTLTRDNLIIGGAQPSDSENSQTDRFGWQS